MAEPLLRIEGLGLALPDLAHRPLFGRAPLRPILQDITLDVAPGECVALVGESGSGKTTLARTVLRLYEPQQGRIVFAGQDITHLHEDALRPLRQRVQMVFQDPLSALNPRHRVGDIVVQPLLSYGRPVDPVGSARALLELVSLPASFATRYPHELSGGQRQRVGIARAIALQPDLVVADEIVSGLDVSTQARILLLLRELRARLGMGLLFVTHDLSVVRVLCDRVVVMKEGRVVEQGRTEAVFRQPRRVYTQTLLHAIPLPEIDDTWLAPPATLSSPLQETEMELNSTTTALVTGANRGLGREIVHALLAAGAAKVYAAARDSAGVQDLVTAHPGRVVALTLDVTNAAQIAAAKQQCDEVNLLVNNAGINRNQGFLAAADVDHAQAEMATNYFGTLAMCRAFAPQLAGGAIVNVLSILAKVTLPAMGSLCASKAASLRLTEGVRAELAAQGTKVIAVMTGALDTDMSRDFQGPKSAPGEVAAAIVAALCSGDEEVYVGEMTGWVNSALAQDGKGLERELAKYLPG
jgi:peptide/nickel transport system ATP-binding protein